ncbi:unnamed protein product [Urochloa humidicola]
MRLILVLSFSDLDPQPARVYKLLVTESTQQTQALESEQGKHATKLYVAGRAAPELLRVIPAARRRALARPSPAVPPRCRPSPTAPRPTGGGLGGGGRASMPAAAPRSRPPRRSSSGHTTPAAGRRAPDLCPPSAALPDT